MWGGVVTHFLLSEGANAPPPDFAEEGFSVAVQQGAFFVCDPKKHKIGPILIK